MIVRVNNSCNVRTGSDVNNPRWITDITIPRFRACLHPAEAEALAKHLLEAVAEAKRIEGKDREAVTA